MKSQRNSSQDEALVILGGLAIQVHATLISLALWRVWAWY